MDLGLNGYLNIVEDCKINPKRKICALQTMYRQVISCYR